MPTSIDPRVQELCDEFEIRIVDKSTFAMPGETRAPATIGKLIRNHGEAHARLVLCILAEGRGNNALITEMSLNAVSGLVRACSEMIDDDASAFLALFDQAPIGPMMVLASELSGVVHQGNALAGMLYLYARDKGLLRGGKVSSAKVKTALASEAEKGRNVPSRRQLKEMEKAEIGRRLLGVKAQLPHGHFGPWLAKSGLSDGYAHDCMRIARQHSFGLKEMKRAA